MGTESNNLASVSSTAIYKLLLAHIGQTVMVTTAAASVVDGVLEGVQVVVEDGLNEGDRVIVEGIQKVRPAWRSR